MNDKTIFVQIASYRDPELLKTVKDAIEKAVNPERLVFSISHQYHLEDQFTKDFNKFLEEQPDEHVVTILNSISSNDVAKGREGVFDRKSLKGRKFIIFDIPYEEAKGACWARHRLQQAYQGEDYTLQLDSHMRFEVNWDETLIEYIEQLQSAGHKKPLITAYVPSFDPDNDPQGRVREPWRMTFDRFIPEGAVFFLPETIPGWQDIAMPVPSRFYSAHMAFTIGAFCEEVQHDLNYYFHGEEISIAVRAYTHGYDLFHPHRVVIWHEYTRKGRTKCWDDDKEWVDKNNKSHLTNRRLFAMDDEEKLPEGYKYGFGTERTLDEYERYSGLRFQDRAVQQYTLDKKYPPNPQYKNEEEYKASFAQIFKHCIDVGLNQVPELDYNFWAVIFQDEEGNDIYRQDATAEDVRAMKLQAQTDGYIKLWRQFETNKRPKKWIVWAHSESKGWMDKMEGVLY